MKYWVDKMVSNGPNWREGILIVVYIMTILTMILLLRSIKKQYKKKDLVAVVAGILILVSIVVTWAVSISYKSLQIYEKGLQYIDNGDYISAMETFSSIEYYADSDSIIEEIYSDYRYQLGMQYEEEGDYLSAMACFIDVYFLYDSKDHFNYCTKKHLEKSEKEGKELWK